MGEKRLDRRQFLQCSALSALGIILPDLPESDSPEKYQLGRVTISSINLHAEPAVKSPVLWKHYRDEILSLREQVLGDEGPTHNPRWYRTYGGYAHSGNLQLVAFQPQAPSARIPEGGTICEICVPYTRAYTKPDPGAKPIYRLYYKSTAWVTKTLAGSDGKTWYGLLDDLLGVTYYVRAEHIRKIHPSEITPLSPDIAPQDKRIEVHLASQELFAFERERLVFKSTISSGIPDPRPRENGIPTITPSGNFYVTRKMALRHMGNGNLTASLLAYELPGVPWVSYFHETGVAFHGTYWHSDFGRPRSHGCVNMQTEEALWLYRWSLPNVPSEKFISTGYGTKVRVI
jgi:hypothetical protein